MCNVNRSIVNCREQDRGCHASAFAVRDDGISLWIFFEVRHPESHIIETELTEGHIEIHFESRGLIRKRGNDLRIFRSCAEILSVITTRLLPDRKSVV